MGHDTMRYKANGKWREPDESGAMNTANAAVTNCELPFGCESMATATGGVAAGTITARQNMRKVFPFSFQERFLLNVERRNVCGYCSVEVICIEIR